jgi:hypothetical protein
MMLANGMSRNQPVWLWVDWFLVIGDFWLDNTTAPRISTSMPAGLSGSDQPSAIS